MKVQNAIDTLEINCALDQLEIDIAQADLDTIVQLYQIKPNNVEVRLNNEVDPAGQLSFISNKRVIDVFNELMNIHNPVVSEPIDVPRLSNSINILKVETSGRHTLISLNESIGRSLDPDFIEFISKLGQIDSQLFIIEFNPTRSRLLELADKSEPFKALHGYPDLQFPEYLTINRSAKRVFSNAELIGLQRAILVCLKKLGIPESLITFHEQDCTIILPKDSLVPKWIQRFAPKLYPYSHLGLTISLVDSCPEPFDEPPTEQLLSFACGGKVIGTKISNRFVATNFRQESRDYSLLFREIAQEYKRIYKDQITIADLVGNDSENEILKIVPYPIRSVVSQSFSYLGIVTSVLPDINWSDYQLDSFNSSLDLSSWEELPSRPKDVKVIAIDPPNSKSEVGFSVKHLDGDGYEVCAYVLNVARLIPVYSSADDILFENCCYVPELGMYPYQVARSIALSEIDDRPLLCVKIRIDKEGSKEVQIFECKGKLDYKLSTYDAGKLETNWSSEVKAHAEMCEFLSQSESAQNRIPVNEYEYCEFSYELHMLTYEMVGKWCAQRQLNVPYRVTEMPRARDEHLINTNNDPRLRNLSNRTTGNLRSSILQTIEGLDSQSRDRLFKSIRARGYFTSNPGVGHWYLGLQNYVPLGGALRRDPCRLALHNITQHLNGYRGLSKLELDWRLNRFNQQQNIDYQGPLSKIKQIRLQSLLIGTEVHTTVEQLLERNSTQTVRCSDGRNYELFFVDRIPLEAKLKIRIIGYNPNTNTFRGELI